MKKTAKPEKKKLRDKSKKVETECYESTIIDIVVY
jgi:hypothetical protein